MMMEAFIKWIKRFGSRPWEIELQLAFNAGYRAGQKDLSRSLQLRPKRK